MPYIYVPDFREGLDTRKMPVNQGGTALIELLDMHITRGGEAEKRKAFVELYADALGETQGLYVGTDGMPVVFSSVNNLPAATGVRVEYLPPVGNRQLSRILDADTFDGKLYVVAQFDDESIQHYYDGTRITSFPTGVTPGTRAIAYKNKMYTISGTTLAFTAIGDPTNYDPASTGAGFIEMNSHAQGYQDLTGLAEYQGNLAIFADDAIQVWFMDDDPALNQQLQILLSTGTFAPDSVIQFGGSDVFYLDRSGVRSLRVRDSSNNAYAQDVGTPIDTLIQDKLAEVGEDEAAAAQAIVEPNDGRYWLAVGERIYVFSFFRQSKVSAWSQYRAPAPVEDMAAYRGSLYIRAGGRVYQYGGATGRTYDESPCEIQLPWLSADSPAAFKQLSGIDLAAENTWDLSIGLDPNRTDVFDDIGTTSRITYPDLDITTRGRSTHFSLRLQCTQPGYARVGSVAIHYQKQDQG